MAAMKDRPEWEGHEADAFHYMAKMIEKRINELFVPRVPPGISTNAGPREWMKPLYPVPAVFMEAFKDE